jgi:YD repeat-containing protein
VTPTIRGVELSAVLRSKLSPQRIGYRLVLPQDAALVSRGASAAVERHGVVLASIPPPTAFDAQHTPVSAAMRVRGNELTIVVLHRSQDVAYPLMIDPRVITYNVTSTIPYWEFAAERDAGSHESADPEIDGPEPGVLTAPEANWGKGPCEECVEEPYLRPRSMWQWSPHFGSTITNVTFEGISLTTSTGNSGDFKFLLGQCWEGSNEEAPPATFSCETANHTVPGFECAPGNCSTAIGLRLDKPPKEYGAVIPTSAETTLSIEAMTIVQNRLRHRRRGPRRGELLGSENEAEPNRTRSCEGDPVDCATGNLTETQTDFHIPGRGVALDLTRTYNSQAASREERRGPFGYGWSWSFGASLERSTSSPEVPTETKTVHQGNGSTVVYSTIDGKTTTAPGVQATLDHIGGNYLFKLPSQTLLTFDGSGQLTRETDRNGNVTKVEEECIGGEEGGGVAQVRMLYADYTTEDISSEDERRCHIQVTDPAGRRMTLYLAADGLVERATDPMGHTVTYEYEDGNLAGITYPGESSPRWRFHYDADHRMTEVIDAKGHATTTSYDSMDRVSEQTDRRGATRHFEYGETGDPPVEGTLYAAAETKEEEDLPEVTEAEEGELGVLIGAGYAPSPPGTRTTITDEATGSVTVERFDREQELQSSTHGYGTADAATEEREYDSEGAPISITDGDSHTTTYTYDSAGNRTSQKDPNGDETKWGYDGKHEVTTTTTPNGEHTTIERDSHGNALTVSRPAPSGTQTTKYGYDGHGELTSMTDPLEHVWKYEYNGDGDRIAEIDPEGHKRTFGFNADSEEITTTSPRGNVTGANPAAFTTIIERDAQGRVVRIIEPLE